jgi:multidrug efflux pump subunit AcrA (membrane-fusion protein)
VIVGMQKWTVSATVDDTEVGLIATGDQAQMTTDNVAGTVFGTVTAVSVLSSDASGSASYPVTIAVTGTPTGLHDGASATVAIIYKQATNVLTVPTLAIHRDSGADPYVYVDKSGQKVKTTVRTGMSSGGTTQITSGLSAGQQVYVEVRTTTGSGTSQNQTTNGTGNRGNFPGGGFFPGGGGNFPRNAERSGAAGGGGFGGGGFGGGGNP